MESADDLQPPPEKKSRICSEEKEQIVSKNSHANRTISGNKKQTCPFKNTLHSLALKMYLLGL